MFQAKSASYTTSLDTDLPLDYMWSLVADTNRLGQIANLPAFERIIPERSLRTLIHSHFFGVPISWHEYPYEWIEQQFYVAERSFIWPVPVKLIQMGLRLEPLSETRTRLHVWLNLQTNGLGKHAALWFCRLWLLPRIRKAYQELVQYDPNALTPPPLLRRPTVNNKRLMRAAEQLRNEFRVDPHLVAHFLAYLNNADDASVSTIQPFALADAWRASRLDVLRMLLYATRVGMVELKWDVVCPSCRGTAIRANTLAYLGNDAHCAACDLHYDINLDEVVEIRFNVHPELRRAKYAPYCIGGPNLAQHVIAQLWVAANSSKEFTVNLKAGDYSVRPFTSQEHTHLQVATGSGAKTCDITFLAKDIIIDQTELKAGEVQFTWHNQTDQNMLVVLEQEQWQRQSASAALVTALSEFRQLFTSEVLAPGIGVAVNNLTFLFSDLKDSTMLYDMIGDAPAYTRVRDHFEIMNEILARRQGALVKTIGDAIMAVFADAEHAMQACLDIQREFTIGRLAKGEPALKIKLGLHRGPCIAVNANEILDYFGSTVNIAARVQNAAIGGDIVITPEILSAPGVRDLLEQENIDCETFERELKGFSQLFTLHRIWVK